MLKIPARLALQSGKGAVDYETGFQCIFEPTADDFDVLGHVNNVVYLRWVQDIAVAHWEHVVSEQFKSDFVWVALRHEIDYRDAILPGELAEGRTWLGRAEGARFERFVDIRKPGAKRVSAQSLTQWCLLNAKTRRPMRVTQDILDCFQTPG